MIGTRYSLKKNSLDLIFSAVSAQGVFSRSLKPGRMTKPIEKENFQQSRYHMKKNKLWIGIAILTLIAVAFFVYKALNPRKTDYVTETVRLGNMVQEVSESGSVSKGEALNLNFKNGGKITGINVRVGDKVAQGQSLAQLDASDFELKRRQAEADLNLANIKFNRLLNGASGEDIKIVQTRVDNAKISVASSRQTLADVENTAAEAVKNIYDNALDGLSEAYTKAYNAQVFADLLQRTYFVPHEDDSIRVFEDAQKNEKAVLEIKNALDTAKASRRNADIDSAIGAALSNLDSIASSLKEIRQICEKEQWRDVVSATDKASLDGHRNLIGDEIVSITAAKQAISSQTVTNSYNINAAKSSLNAVLGLLDAAQNEYDSLTAQPRSEDVALLKTQIDLAKTQLDLLNKEIDDCVLTSPVAGEVIAVNNRAGEMASIASSLATIVILPSDPYEIDIDIYEEDVVKFKVGAPVTITLTAVPDKTFFGKVISVDPAQKIINGVVYYGTKISFDDAPEVLKPGMSADVVIIAAERNGVAVVSESALQKNDAGYFVQVLENGKTRDIAVLTGISSKGQVEILSGLSGGEEVIIP
jgi:RND family efflux transporter MFP subunit